MRLVLDESGNFYARELVTDSDGAKITSGITLELRIFELDTFKLYDWDDDTFKSSAVVDDEDECSHQQAGGVYDTGIWKNNTAIDKDAFTDGYTYVFEFYDSTNDSLISQREVAWGSYAPLALVSNQAAIASAIGNLNDISASQVATALRTMTGWSDGDTEFGVAFGMLMSKYLGLAITTESDTVAGRYTTIFKEFDATSKNRVRVVQDVLGNRYTVERYS